MGKGDKTHTTTNTTTPPLQPHDSACANIGDDVTHDMAYSGDQLTEFIARWAISTSRAEVKPREYHFHACTAFFSEKSLSVFFYFLLYL